MILLLLAAAAAEPDIVVTASLEPVREEESPASVTVIDEKRIEALGAPFVSDLARFAPGVSVSVSGAQGSLTQIRIRGAEANHSLLFVDGIAFNDPAAGNEARFENFAADGLSRMEIVRGPQSALWGSEALGGVIALDSGDPFSGTRLRASAEYGSRDFSRAHVAVTAGGDKAGSPRASPGCRATESTFSEAGPAIATASATWPQASRPRPGSGSDGEIGFAGHYIRAKSEFDGTPPPFFVRSDTLNSSRAELGAARVWARLGLAADAPWSLQLEGQYLHSSNRNRNGDEPLNRTLADRLRIGGKLIRRFHRRPPHPDRRRRARGRELRSARPGGLLRARPAPPAGRTAFVGEWRAQWAAPSRPTSPSAATTSTASRIRRRSGPASSPAPPGRFASMQLMARASPSRPSSTCTASTRRASSAILL